MDIKGLLKEALDALGDCVGKSCVICGEPIINKAEAVYAGTDRNNGAQTVAHKDCWDTQKVNYGRH